MGKGFRPRINTFKTSEQLHPLTVTPAIRR